MLKAPVRLTLSTAAQSASLILAIERSRVMPALFTSKVGGFGELRDGGFHGIGIGDIDAHELMREAFNVLRLADIEGVDLRAGFAERIGDRPADAAAAAGDDGAVIAKVEARLTSQFRFDQHRRGHQTSDWSKQSCCAGRNPLRSR